MVWQKHLLLPSVVSSKRGIKGWINTNTGREDNRMCSSGEAETFRKRKAKKAANQGTERTEETGES